MTKQNGQTLVETMVAVFIMVMGITAALGLANYSLNASTSIRKQIIGIGLAREGIEAVKNARDTNWLQGQLSTNCFNYVDSSTTGKCYRDWLGPVSGAGYTITVNTNLYIGFDATNPATNGYWTGGTGTNVWALNNSSDPTHGLYQPSASSSGSSGFYRKVLITPDTSGPFNTDNGARLLVTSQVWWTDKRCPASPDWPGLNKCSVQLQTYLTNWKTY